MKKQFICLLFSLFSVIGLCANSHAIKHISSVHGLCDVTKAFLSLPECKHDFRLKKAHSRSVMPSPTYKGVEKDVLEEVTAEHLKMFKGPKNAGFRSQNQWLGTPLDINKHTKKPSHDTERYVQKIKIPAGSTVCFLGDIHGSIHSLIRTLWRLVVLGHLNEDLTIKNKNFYIVFLGDYVDRGRWGAEVVTTLMLLKQKNWNNVFPVAGNHETGFIATRYGFFEELQKKFDSAADQLYNDVNNKFFKLLPVALFIECEGNVVQCCHGGIEPNYNPIDFLDCSRALFQSVGSEQACAGLFWNDFCQTGEDAKSHRGGSCIVAGRNHTLEYLNHNNIKHIMRAHQDQEYGFKLFFADAVDLQGCSARYQNGPYYWIPVFNSLGLGHIFPLAAFAHHPVFTLSTAAEGQALPYDCFGLMQTGLMWNDWMMEMYELFLGRGGNETDREGKFVCLCKHNNAEVQTERVVPSGLQEEDLISVSWHAQFNENRLDEGLMDICAH